MAHFGVHVTNLIRAEIAVSVEELRLQEQASEGYTVGVVAALTFITKAAGMAPADLAGLHDQSLWKAACKAHAKWPELVHHLPDVPLSRVERFAVTYGLRRQLPELPVADDLPGLVKVIYGEPVFSCLYAIT